MRLIGTEEFDYIASLVHNHSRIHLGEDKKALVTARLSKRLAQLNINNFKEYCHLLNSSAGKEELPRLLDVISTNFTHFFREPKHFDFLYHHILPEWTKRMVNHRAPFRVWSAGCSSGEEPYSIAILLANYFGNQSPVSWQVVASDLSTRVLKVAEEGVYRSNQVKKVKTEWLREYFRKGVDQWEGFYRIKPSLRSQVFFCHLNLFQPNNAFRPGFHVIFCRNVMIYFDRETQEELIKRLSHYLLPGGFLVVGHAEGLTSIKHSLIKRYPSVVQKPG
jgi:chemotaxis protein methyltransferase CheR